MYCILSIHQRAHARSVSSPLRVLSSLPGPQASGLTASKLLKWAVEKHVTRFLSAGSRSSVLLVWTRYLRCSLLDSHRTKRKKKSTHRSHSSLLHGCSLCLYPFRQYPSSPRCLVCPSLHIWRAHMKVTFIVHITRVTNENQLQTYFCVHF